MTTRMREKQFGTPLLTELMAHEDHVRAMTSKRTSQEKRALTVNRFADPSLQGMFEKMLALAADLTSELYHDGKPRRGAGHRAAFWDGYSGMTLTGKNRSPHAIPRTLSHACLTAGQEFARRQRKASDAGTTNKSNCS